MLRNIMELAACMAEAFICINFAVRYFGFVSEKFKPVKFALFFSAIMVLEIIVTFGSINEVSCIITFICIFTIMSKLFLNGKIIEFFLISCLLYFIIIAVNMTILTLFSTVLTQKYYDLIRDATIARLMILIITKALLYLITSFILVVKRRNSLVLSKTEVVAILATFILTGSVGLSVREIMKNENLSPIFFLYILCSMIALNIITFIFLLKISQKNREETEMKLLKLQLRLQEVSMLETDQRYDETTKIRHDIKNYVNCALSLAENGEYERLIEYLREFSEVKIGKIQQYIQTESRVVNAVLNSKLTVAAENNIAIECVVTGELGTVNEMDFGIMLSNLLDNAIEACMKNKGPSRLCIDISNTAAYLCVKIRNTSEASVFGNNTELKTTKPDRKNHGLGLKSVRDIVNKYSGSINFQQKNDEFSVNIILCSV